jgi:hypothetical protein
MTEYDIYLVPTRNREDRNQEAEDRPIVSPVTGHEIDFYDSGVWLTRESGRNFFPYEQIRTITEHTGGEGPERSDEGSSEA